MSGASERSKDPKEFYQCRVERRVKRKGSSGRDDRGRRGLREETIGQFMCGQVMGVSEAMQSNSMGFLGSRCGWLGGKRGRGSTCGGESHKAGVGKQWVRAVSKGFRV